MKRMFAIMLAAAMVVALFAVLPLSASADEPIVWSGKANIKWYIDGLAENAEEWHIKTAEDLAGLARLVSASGNSCYNGGVYYDENYDVIGYKRTDNSEQKPYADSSLCKKPSADDDWGLIEGHDFAFENVYLDADIVLNTGNAADWGETPPANVWLPIGGTLNGDASWPAFSGIFQGEGHTISGAYYVADPAKSIGGVGLFGCVGKASSSQFRNLTLENSYFSGVTQVGTLCGRSSGTITVKNCHIKDCFAVGTNNKSGQQTGGLIGGVYGGGATIENCGIENVTVTAPRAVGGFIGTSVGQTVSVKNCYVTGSVTAHTVDVANSDETISHLYGFEAGIVDGRAAGGSYSVENVYMNVKVSQLGKAEDQTGDYLAQAGVFYAGKGSVNVYPAVWYEGIYCVMDFTAEKILGIDEVEGFDQLDSLDFTVVTSDALTGSTAARTLQEFDFDTLWETTESGMPQLRFAKLAADEIAARSSDEGDGDDDEQYSTKPVTPGKTDKTTTEAKPATNETPGASEQSGEKSEKKGCGSVIVGLPAIGSILLAGALMLRKKKED